MTDNHHLTIASTAHSQLVALDNSTSATLTHAYTQMMNTLTPLYALLDHIKADQSPAEEDGESVPPSLAYHAEVQAVKQRLVTQAQRFVAAAQQIIAHAQHQAIDLGLSSSHAHLSHMQIAPIRLPSPTTLASHIDVTQPHMPRARLFAQLAPEATRVAMNALTVGISTGQDVSTIAASVGGALKSVLHRAIAIASTAIAAAYRGAVDTLVGNNASEKILGWYWVADLSGSPCLACIFMHGSKHPLSEELGSHPRCHCQKVFYTAATPPMQTGSDWLAQQSVEVQKATFDSDALYALYKAGTPLSAFVGRESDPIWGSSIFVKPLKDISK